MSRSETSAFRAKQKSSVIREPYGPEGFRWIREPLAVNDLAIAHGVKLRVPLVHVRAALALAPLAKHEDDFVATCIDESFRFHRPVVPHLGPPHGVLNDRLPSPRNSSIRKVRSVPLDVRVTEQQSARWIVSEKRLPHLSNYLDVLLRHRQRSSSGATRNVGRRFCFHCESRSDAAS